jgi:hypothetical protein
MSPIFAPRPKVGAPRATTAISDPSGCNARCKGCKTAFCASTAASAPVRQTHF